MQTLNVGSARSACWNIGVSTHRIYSRRYGSFTSSSKQCKRKWARRFWSYYFFFHRAEQISWHLPSRASPPSTNTKTHPLSHNCCPMLIYVVAHPSCVCARMFLHNRSYRQTRMRLAQLVCFSFNLSIFHYYIGVEMFKYMFYLMYTRAATLKPI